MVTVSCGDAFSVGTVHHLVRQVAAGRHFRALLRKNAILKRRLGLSTSVDTEE